MDVGGNYDGEKFFDHHQFEPGNIFYGLSSAGLIYDSPLNKYHRTELYAFIKQVDARDTRVNYDPENKYEPILKLINKCNLVDVKSKEQDERFKDLVFIVAYDVLHPLAEGLEPILNRLETMAAKTQAANAEEFSRREKISYINKNGDSIAYWYGKYYPTWINDLCYTAPLFVYGEWGKTKVMCNTDICTIVDISNREFIHANGFLAVANSFKEVIVRIKYNDTGDEFDIPVSVHASHRTLTLRSVHMDEHDLLEEYYDDTQEWVIWKVYYPKVGGLQFVYVSGEEGGNMTTSYWKNSKEEEERRRR
jgi:hypothetical protein